MRDTSLEYYYKIVGRILKVVGFEIPNYGWDMSNPILIINYILMLLQPYMSIMYIITNIDSIGLVTECASVSATAIQLLVKCSLIFYYRDGWIEILELVRKHRSGFVEKYDGILSFHTHRLAKFVIILWILYVMVLIGFSIFPIFHPDPNKLPLSFNFPHLPWDENPYWTLNYIHHIYSCVVASHFSSGIDGITLLLILHTYCRIDIMMEMLNELQALIDQKVLDHDLEKEIDLKLKSLYTEHFITLDFVDKCQKYFSMILLVQVLTDTMIICMSLFVIATPTISSNGCYIFLTAGTAQHFVSCYFGNILIVRNDNFIHKIYNIDWYKMNVKQQKSLQLVLQSAQRPCEITALFFKINLESFLAVVKTSYSYFAILQEMDE